MAADFIIAMPIYQGMDLLDVAGPFETFQWMADSWDKKKIHVYLVAEVMVPVTTRNGVTGGIQIIPHKSFDEVPQVDLLWIPGGDPAVLPVQMRNPKYVHFIQSRARTAQFVTSVCEGALIAANAGLLDGFEATTHWAFVECLKSYPKVKVAPGYPRYIHSGNRVTGGGISSGIDEALYLVKLIAGDDVANEAQETMQYFPEPPTSGKLGKRKRCPLAGKIPVKPPAPIAFA